MEESVPSGSVCCFCRTTFVDEALYGKFYKIEEITTHYFCLLLSSKVQQRGSDDEGILGFLPIDIRNEIQRGKKVMCSYCGNSGATISCYHSRCRVHFHLPCGRVKNTFHQFFGEFKSFCYKHRKAQKIKKEVLNAMSDKQSTCAICLESVPATPSPATLWAPCCNKEAWFHRLCIQRLALSAGYFFKCPLCNNTAQFVEAMRTYGIWIPEQDASWERDPERYDGLLQRHNSCDAKSCRCRQGRTFHLENTKWEIKLCSDCGSQGMHVDCGNLRIKKDWVCAVCAAVVASKAENKVGKISRIRQAIMNRNRNRRSLPARPARRVTRQTILCGSEMEEGKEKVEGSLVSKIAKLDDAKTDIPSLVTNKETPSHSERVVSPQPIVPVTSETKEAITPHREPEHTNSDVEIIDVTENSDDEIQRWRTRKNTSLTCLCKGSKRPYWSRSVHHAIESSISSCCPYRYRKHLHHGKPSATSIKNSDNELLSRFFSSLTSCPGTSVDKREPRYHHLWVIHHYQLENFSGRRRHTSRRIKPPRRYSSIKDSASDIAPESTSRGRSQPHNWPSAISRTDKERKPKNSPAKLKAECSGENRFLRSNSYQQLNEISPSLPLSTYSLRSYDKSKKQQLGDKLKSIVRSTDHNTSVSSKRSLPKMNRRGRPRKIFKSCEREKVQEASLSNTLPLPLDFSVETSFRSSQKRSSSCDPLRKVNLPSSFCKGKDSSSYPNKQSKRKRSCSPDNIWERCSKRTPNLETLKSSSLRKHTKDKLSPFSASSSDYHVGDGLDLAKLPEFQPVVLIRRKCSFTERGSDQVGRLKAGRSRREQFYSKMQHQSRNLNDGLEESVTTHNSRKRSRKLKNIVARSPVRTRSRSRSRDKAGRSQREQFYSKMQHQSRNLNDGLEESVTTHNSRKRSRKLKDIVVRSPVRTRSRSRSLDCSRVQASLDCDNSNTSSKKDASRVSVQNNLDLPGKSCDTAQMKIANRDKKDKEETQSTSSSSSNEICWKDVFEVGNIHETMVGFSMGLRDVEISLIDENSQSTFAEEDCDDESTCSDDSSLSTSSFRILSFRPPTPPPQSSTCSSFPISIPSTSCDTPTPETYPSSSVTASLSSRAIPTLLHSVTEGTSTEFSLSRDQIQSDSQDTSCLPIVTSQPSSIVPVESILSDDSISSGESENVSSTRRSPRSLSSVRTYKCRTRKRTLSDTFGTISVRRSSPPPIFPRRSGSPTEMECRMKARALTARKFVPMSRVATEQRAMLRKMQISHERQ